MQFGKGQALPVISNKFKTENKMMSPDFGSPIKFLLYVIFIILALFIISVTFGVCNYDDDKIESDKKIAPKMKIEISVEGNKVISDTTYIYEK